MLVATLSIDPAVGEVERNRDAALAAVDVAAALGARIAVLPEMWPTSFVPAAGGEDLCASDAAVEALVAHSARYPGLVVVGSAFGAPPAAGGLPTNRAHVVTGGAVVGGYDKVHLFSPTAEALAFRAGDAPPPTFEVAGTRLAPLVCYDLRFPEVARAAFRAGAEVLAVTAQWPVARAPHLAALVRGRAAELEGFVVATNRTGVDVVGRRRMRLEFDAAMCAVAGPSGELVPAVERREVENPGRAASVVTLHRIEPEDARALRRSVPVARDARSELFGGWLAGGG